MIEHVDVSYRVRFLGENCDGFKNWQIYKCVKEFYHNGKLICFEVRAKGGTRKSAIFHKSYFDYADLNAFTVALQNMVAVKTRR